MKKTIVAGVVMLFFFCWAEGSWGNIKIEKNISPLQGIPDRTTIDTAYADLGDSKVIIYWDAAKYSSPTVYFEAVLASSDGSGTAYAKLQEEGSSTEVSGSEVSVTGTAYTRVRSSAITLTDGMQYKVITRTDNAGYTATLRASRIIIAQDASAITATETHIFLSPYYSAGITQLESTYDQRFYYDGADWDGTVTILFEATLRSSSAGKIATATLWDFTGNTAVSGASVNNTGLSMTRGSVSVSLTSGRYYGVKVNGGSGYTARMSNAKLIFQQSETITKTQTHIPILYNGTPATGSSYADLNFPVRFDPADWSGVSNTYFHQASCKPAPTDVNNIIFTELYDSTGSAPLDERRWSSPNGSSSSWTVVGPSSPVAVPTTASTLTTRLKHPGTTSGYAANRLIVQSFIGNTANFAKEVHLQSGENLSNTGTDWTEMSITAIPFKWEPSNYTHPRVYFEAVLKTGGASTYATAAIFKTSDLATPVAESQLFSRSSSYERLRSGLLRSLTDGQEYVVQIRNAGTEITAINTCRLLIYQEAASIDKIETQPFLNGYDSHTNPSYAEGATPIYYRYDGAQFDGTVAIDFEVYMLSGFSATAYAQIYEVGGAAVAGSELSTSSGAAERLRTASPISLTSGRDYVVKLKTSDAGNAGILYGAKLIIRQSGTGLTKTESAFQLVHNDNSGAGYTDTSYTAQDFWSFFEPRNGSGNTPACYHEATFKVAGASKTGYLDLYNREDAGTIANSELTTTGASWARSRSSSLTMPAANKTLEMREQVTAGGTLHVSGQRLIVQSTFGTTAVFLASLTASRDGQGVRVEWETKTEINNRGFNLYRSAGPGEAYGKLNGEIIPGLFSSAIGKRYAFHDAGPGAASAGYYLLEDIDLKGARTFHGPVYVAGQAEAIAQVPTPGASGAVSSPGGIQPAAEPSGSTATGASSLPRAGGAGVVSGGGRGSGVTRVALKGFRASWIPDGALVEWQTGYEVNNLGFHIYREEGGQLTRLTPEPVAGAALLAGAGATTAGHSYSWIDSFVVRPSRGPRPSARSTSPAPLSSIRYWLEDVDLSGKRTLEGPISPVASGKPLPPRSQAVLLSELARLRSKIDPDLAKGQALQSRLRSRSAALPGQRAEVLVQGVDVTGGRAAGGPFGGPISDRPVSDLARLDRLSPAEAQWVLAATPAVKIFIQKEGWYRIPWADLAAAGLDPRVNPRFLQLFVDGREHPIQVSGEKNGRFGPQGAIEFHATGVDNAYTDTRVCWLVAGAKFGMRVEPASRNAVGRSRPGPASFPFTVEKREREIYFAALNNGETDNFFGRMVMAGAVDEVLRIKNLDPASIQDGLLEVKLQGVTEADHRVKVMLNGLDAGEMNFSGQSSGSFKAPFPQRLLRDGDNTVTLAAQGGEMDISLVDTIRLTYERAYEAEDDRLRFSAAGGTLIGVGGFSGAHIRVFDITDPRLTKELTGKVGPQGAGYAVRLEVPGSGPRALLALTDERAMRPAALEANRPSNWHAENHGADLLIVAHGDFLETVKPLQELRESQGWSVALVDVEELYDEFSFGAKTPRALKDFLARARAVWRQPARFLLLVGDASYDPRNYLGFGGFDFVPTQMVETEYLETASDDWIADFDGDGLPEMAVGRLPARTPEEARTMVAKIAAYERNLERRNPRVVLVADMVDTFNFETASLAVEALIPGSYAVQEIFRHRFADDEEAHRQLMASVNQGPFLVHYVGHGSVEVWRGGLFSTENAAALTNGPNYPLFINMTCLNGYFQIPNVESIAEALLKARQGGAVAVWASSGLTLPEGQAPMDRALIRLLFQGGASTLGEAVLRAKAATPDLDVRKTWILFGDPTTRIRF